MKDKTILITGITGTFGKAMTKRLLKLGVKKIVGINRNETNRTMHELEFINKGIKCYTCDISDKDIMEKIIRVEKPDVIMLAAAMKHINYCQEHPEECFKTNIYANQQLIDLAIKYKVPKVVFLSTDKATNPSTIYGTSKWAIEQYIDCINSEDTIITKTRYGNVLGSNGSVLQIWKDQKAKGLPITVTNPNMTRFFMTIDEAIDLVLCATENGENKDLFVFNNKSCTVGDLADCISDNQIVTGTEYIEKTDEALLTTNEREHLGVIKMQDGRETFLSYNKKNKQSDIYGQPLTSDNAERFTHDELMELVK